MWPNFTMAGWICVPVIGLACVVWGYYALVKLIPSRPAEEKVRTDFYSARASYYLIGVGLLILFLWSVSAMAIRTLAILKALDVI